MTNLPLQAGMRLEPISHHPLASWGPNELCDRMGHRTQLFQRENIWKHSVPEHACDLRQPGAGEPHYLPLAKRQKVRPSTHRSAIESWPQSAAASMPSSAWGSRLLDIRQRRRAGDQSSSCGYWPQHPLTQGGLHSDLILGMQGCWPFLRLAVQGTSA